MNVATTVVSPAVKRLDPLAYLPCSKLRKYAKGETIYSEQQPCTNLSVVIRGKVAVSRTATGPCLREILIDIYREEDFFGKWASSDVSRTEKAVALVDTEIMTWTADEINRIAAQKVSLAIALIQVMAERCEDFKLRMETFAVDEIPRRLARALLRFAGRLGAQNEDGFTAMMPIAHHLLGEHIGTSRELVTSFMNRFRRLGYVRYSRSGIWVNANALKTWLDEERRYGIAVERPKVQLAACAA